MMLIGDHEKCVGCRSCESACSLQHEDMCRRAVSCIQIVKREAGGVDLRSVFRQCKTPMCREVRPADAPYRDEGTGAQVTIGESPGIR